jgi:hypothetical protein
VFVLEKILLALAHEERSEVRPGPKDITQSFYNFYEPRPLLVLRRQSSCLLGGRRRDRQEHKIHSFCNFYESNRVLFWQESKAPARKVIIGKGKG